MELQYSCMAVRFAFDDAGVVDEVLGGGIVGPVDGEVPWPNQLLDVVGVHDGMDGVHYDVGIHGGDPLRRAFHLFPSNVLG